MSVKKPRQITPPAIRIWAIGLGATALAAAANAGWLWICINIFNWEVLVPKTFQSVVYTDASLLRISLTTAAAGLLATLAAVGLAKIFIGPRLWFLVIGLGFGLASTYGALTLVNVSLTVKFALSVMHILATFLIILPIAEALKIRESDLHRADLRYHEHLESKTSDDTTMVSTTSTVASVAADDTYDEKLPSTDTIMQTTDTTVIPLATPSQQEDGSPSGTSTKI